MKVHSLACGLIALVMMMGFVPAAPGGERFGDITVVPQAFASGETHHGYREFRILLENSSPKDAHQVLLQLPDNSFAYGNSIAKLTRTVSVGPSSRAVVSLWQPPVPIGGDGNVRVWIDDEDVGVVTLPEASRHVNRFARRYGGPSAVASTLVSRSLNFDDVSRVFNSARPTFAAGAATGEPDSSGHTGMTTMAWSPNPSQRPPHWIEFDFEKPIRADDLRIYATIGMPPGGEIIMTGISGTNFPRVYMSLTYGGSQDFTFPLTPEPVKTVRLDFGSMYAGTISIDAVELRRTDGSTNAWASSARASSEAPISPGMVFPSGPVGGARPHPGPIPLPGSELRGFLRAEVPSSMWSESWLSYTPYDAIFLNDADMAAMPPAISAALWHYVECGGNLVLLGTGEPPQPWASRLTRLAGGRQYDVGFGRCFIFPAKTVTDLEPAGIKMLANAMAESASFWCLLPNDTAANASFPVIENARLPIRGTVFAMLVFVILIGPVNLVVLSRMNRRTWLLWTIPATSFVTCMMVFVYSMLREGITPDVRMESLTLLDQLNRRASTVGRTAFYCPLTPSQGLFFGFDTEATPLIETFEERSGTQREMDWTESQHLSRGWVTARVPAHFQVRKSETRRERLEFSEAGNQHTVVNGLGATVRTLWFKDVEGRLFTATGIPAGQTAILTPSSNSSAGGGGARSLLPRIGAIQVDEIVSTNAPSYLMPRTYIAELEANPFLENALGPKAKSARTKSRCVVYGVLEPRTR